MCHIRGKELNNPPFPPLSPNPSSTTRSRVEQFAAPRRAEPSGGVADKATAGADNVTASFMWQKFSRSAARSGGGGKGHVELSNIGVT